jgi:predicted phage-related endonuclease
VSRTVRAFRRNTERQIEARFGIVRPVTDAIRLLPPGQENTDRWLAARSATIGASEVSILMMDDHPYHSRFSLWHVKANGWGRFGQTDAQERGHLLEPGIARRFADAHPELIIGRPNGALWQDPQLPALTCTPDFLTIDENGVVAPLECKSDEGGSEWGSGPEDIPAQYWWQVTQQMGVFAAPHGYVARWNSWGYRDYTIGYDHARYSAAGAAAQAFLDDVNAGRCPEPDAHKESLAVLRDMDPVFAAALARLPSEWGDELDALKESRKHIDKQIKAIEAQIRDRMGSAPTGYDMRGRAYHRTRTERKGYTAPPTVIDQVRSSAPPKIRRSDT